MAKYPIEAYAPVMDYYKTLPEELKKNAGTILADFEKRYKEGEAPPEEMLTSLKELVDKEAGNLEAKTKAARSEMAAKGASPPKKLSGPFGLPTLTRPQAALGLGLLVLALAALAPISAPATIGYSAATAYATSLYAI